ncbi:hypothetical protein EYZ11_013438 [Aspergillus tanneri]|uniref:Uncharacterized protein n=1 Tax=Aspergillus tanneri TaxID=1220188 RepID=A0A4S3IXN7_9EURO|nr:uncharacterized protein ATNIH1004_006834 [Aspergillus tanneri]KAA8645415.1 hypothetical protein ATNIH1004_006834 [Aspergillus tanneri]THC87116.1 hypothetical protein EYZ11_013438 [Aspergillus tanneri]
MQGYIREDRGRKSPPGSRTARHTDNCSGRHVPDRRFLGISPAPSFGTCRAVGPSSLGKRSRGRFGVVQRPLVDVNRSIRLYMRGPMPRRRPVRRAKIAPPPLLHRGLCTGFDCPRFVIPLRGPAWDLFWVGSCGITARDGGRRPVYAIPNDQTVPPISQRPDFKRPAFVDSEGTLQSRFVFPLHDRVCSGVRGGTKNLGPTLHGARESTSRRIVQGPLRELP